jgi:hypothetical protein
MNRFIGSSPNYYTIADLHNLEPLDTNLLTTLHFLCNFSSPQLKSSNLQVSTFSKLSLSHVTTDGQSANLSWNKAPIWGLRSDFYYCLTIAVFWYGAPSLARGLVCLLQCTMYNIQYSLLSQIWDSPNLEDQVPVFISPRNRVARLYPQALVSGLPYLL